jgi:hypothetical protein
MGLQHLGDAALGGLLDLASAWAADPTRWCKGLTLGVGNP